MLCLFGIIYSLIIIINWKKDVDNNKGIIEEIKENITIDGNVASYKIDFKLLKNDSMFGTLKDILNKKRHENEQNHKVILVIEKVQYEYQVFSSYLVVPEDYYINTIFKTNKEFDKFVKTLKSKLVYDYKVEVSEEDKIFTLSSYTGDGKKRIVLHAKLVEKLETK